MNKSQFVLASLVLGTAAASTSSAAFVTEYFNDYGPGSGGTSSSSDDVDLVGLNGGSGWSGAWAGSTGPEYYSGTPDGDNSNFPYVNGLIFANAGYDNTANQTTRADDGLARYQQGASASGSPILSRVATRPFNALTGTIWVSALAQQSGTQGEVLLYLDNPANDYIGFRRNDDGNSGTTDPIVPVIAVNSVQEAASNDNAITQGALYLLIAKIEIDVDGTNDSLKFWAKSASQDISNEVALGTPLYTKSGMDIFESSMDGIGAAFLINGSRMDAIRISNDADAYDKVVSVPEPASLGLLALSGLAMLRRRR